MTFDLRHAQCDHQDGSGVPGHQHQGRRRRLSGVPRPSQAMDLQTQVDAQCESLLI